MLLVEGPGCKLMSHAMPSSETEITSATALGVQETASEAASSSPASMTGSVKSQRKPFTDCVNLASLCIDPVENCCSIEFVNETSSVHNPNHEPPGAVSRDSYIVTSRCLNVCVKNQSYVSIFQEKQLSNSRSEILSESSLQTVFLKTSYETEPSQPHLHEVEFENCDHELILVEGDTVRYSGYGTLDLAIHPLFHNDRVTASTSASNNPVQDLKSIGDLVNCEFMVKSVSCVSKYAHLEMVMNHTAGAINNSSCVSDSLSVKQTVVADMTSSMNETQSKPFYESENTVFSSTEKATNDNGSYDNDLTQSTVSGVASFATPHEATVPDVETHVLCTVCSCDMKVKSNIVCNSNLETNKELLSDVSTGGTLNVVQVASLTPSHSESMDSGLEKSNTKNTMTADSRSVNINPTHYMGTCGKVVGTEDCLPPALKECEIVPQTVFVQLPAAVSQSPVLISSQFPLQSPPSPAESSAPLSEPTATVG